MRGIVKNVKGERDDKAMRKEYVRRIRLFRRVLHKHESLAEMTRG